MNNRRWMSLLILAVGFARILAGETYSNFTDAFVEGVKTQKFVAILFHTSGPYSTQMKAVLDEIDHDQTIHSHVVFGEADVENERVGYNIASDLKLQVLPTISLFTPNPDLVQEIGRIEGAHDAGDVRIRLLQYMCSAADKKVPAVPSQDVLMRVSCRSVADTSGAQNGKEAPSDSILPDQKIEPTNLHGVWKGKAVRNVCGTPSGSLEIELVLEDRPYQRGKYGLPFGNLSGTLKVSGQNSGIVAAWFEAGQIRTDPLARISGSVSLTHFTEYFLNLQRKDSSMLTGTLSRKNEACEKRGDAGEILNVELQKQ